MPALLVAEHGDGVFEFVLRDRGNRQLGDSDEAELGWSDRSSCGGIGEAERSCDEEGGCERTTGGTMSSALGHSFRRACSHYVSGPDCSKRNLTFEHVQLLSFETSSTFGFRFSYVRLSPHLLIGLEPVHHSWSEAQSSCESWRCC